MTDSILQAIYLGGVVAGGYIRRMQHRQAKQSQSVEKRTTRLERVLLIVQMFGMIVIPLFYIFTPFLDFADYDLPGWVGFLGFALLIASQMVLIKAHWDLGRNWSSRLRIRKGHEFVSNGIYSQIRHPMYAAHWIWGIAQLFLLQNWIVGPATLYTYLPFYLHRVPREEQLLIDSFGRDYQAYMQRTGRIVPGIKRI